MRVLLVTNRYPTRSNPGSSPAIEHQRRALQQLGLQVDVLLIESERSRSEYLKAMWRVFWQCQILGRYDVVHAHYGYSGLVARMQWRCPVVVTFRGSDVLSPRERPFSLLAARFADRAIVMTGEMKRVLGEKDAEVVPYGIDLETFSPRDRTEARKELGVPEEAPIVLFPYDPGRTVKRFGLAEEAVGLLRERFPDVLLEVVHGKPPSEVAAYMSAADVMVLTSSHEGSPVAIGEAMACNLPIVSVDVGDVAGTISGVEQCYLAEGTAEDISNKLAMVLQAQERTLGRKVAEQVSTLRSAGRILEIYRDLTRGSNPGRREDPRDRAEDPGKAA